MRHRSFRSSEEAAFGNHFSCTFYKRESPPKTATPAKNYFTTLLSLDRGNSQVFEDFLILFSPCIQDFFGLRS